MHDGSLNLSREGEKRVVGTVKWFYVRKHYNFINRKNTRKESFVHKTAADQTAPPRNQQPTVDQEQRRQRRGGDSASGTTRTLGIFRWDFPMTLPAVWPRNPTTSDASRKPWGQYHDENEYDPIDPLVANLRLWQII